VAFPCSTMRSSIAPVPPVVNRRLPPEKLQALPAADELDGLDELDELEELDEELRSGATSEKVPLSPSLSRGPRWLTARLVRSMRWRAPDG